MNNSIKKIILRILEISFENRLSHIGSCIGAAQIIYDIYNNKKKDEIFILSSGHAWLAELCTKEHFGLINNPEELILKFGMHPKRQSGAYISSGSLGMAASVALGAALVRSDNVHVLISDGELASGAIWEVFYLACKKNVKNLRIYINYNGYSAYDTVEEFLINKINIFSNLNIKIYNTTKEPIFSLLPGLSAHYEVLSKTKYKEIKEYYEKL